MIEIIVYMLEHQLHIYIVNIILIPLIKVLKNQYLNLIHYYPAIVGYFIFIMRTKLFSTQKRAHSCMYFQLIFNRGIKIHKKSNN